jgi:hypothetical protein
MVLTMPNLRELAKFGKTMHGVEARLKFERVRQYPLSGLVPG